MKAIKWQSRVGKAIIAFSLVCAFGLAAGTSAQAQYNRGQRDDRSEQNRRNRDWNRNRNDRHRDRDDRDWNRNDDYRNNGQYGQYGRNNGQYGRNNNVYRIAQQQGYQDGLNTGASDGQRGQSYNPERSHFYKSGTEGYSSSYGNKEAYKQAYRNAFVQGYQQGFQRYGRNGQYYPRNNRTGSILGDIFGRP